MECKCWHCNKSYQRKFDEKLNERFFSIYKFSKFSYYCQRVFILMNTCIAREKILPKNKLLPETSLPKKRRF